MFHLVTESNLRTAAEIHGQSWRESHKSFCAPDFIQAHTTDAQMDYIRREIAQGKVFYLLTLDTPKGIVSLHGSLIENLYVRPGEQRKGYGTQFLHYAEGLCRENPTLWILSNNNAARSLYLREGYVFTGNRKELKHGLAELEMRHELFHGI